MKDEKSGGDGDFAVPACFRSYSIHGFKKKIQVATLAKRGGLLQIVPHFSKAIGAGLDAPLELDRLRRCQDRPGVAQPLECRIMVHHFLTAGRISDHEDLISPGDQVKNGLKHANVGFDSGDDDLPPRIGTFGRHRPASRESRAKTEFLGNPAFGRNFEDFGNNFSQSGGILNGEGRWYVE